MALRSFYAIEINGIYTRKEYNYYPTPQEIEEAIMEMFPNGYIYDQYADENIYPNAQVKKYYKLEGNK